MSNIYNNMTTTCQCEDGHETWAAEFTPLHYRSDDFLARSAPVSVSAPDPLIGYSSDRFVYEREWNLRKPHHCLRRQGLITLPRAASANRPTPASELIILLNSRHIRPMRDRQWSMYFQLASGSATRRWYKN